MRSFVRIGILAQLGVVLSCSGGGPDIVRENDGTGGRASSSRGSEAGGAPILSVESGGQPGFTLGPDGSVGGAPGACVTDTAEARPAPLDIALLVDTSYSMDFELRWQYVKGALLAFLSGVEKSDLGVALQLFPDRLQCSTASYGDPAVPMASFAAARPEIERVVNARRMSGGTPIVQALQGTGAYVVDWAKQPPDRRSVVVLATDGVPDSTCSGDSFDPPNSLENAARVAQDLAQGTPSVPVFVIGVGKELDTLHRIAEAGGTDKATLVQDGSSAQQALLAALEDVQRRSLGCEYTIPSPSSGDIDYEKVNVEYTERGQRPSTFLYVDGEAGCSAQHDGWHYDDAAAPKKIVLCPEACSRVARASGARIDLAYGCRRNELLR